MSAFPEALATQCLPLLQALGPLLFSYPSPPGWYPSHVQHPSRNPLTPPAVVDQPFVGIVYVVLLSAAQHIIYLVGNFLVTT